MLEKQAQVSGKDPGHFQKGGFIPEEGYPWEDCQKWLCHLKFPAKMNQHISKAFSGMF